MYVLFWTLAESGGIFVWLFCPCPGGQLHSRPVGEAPSACVAGRVRIVGGF